MIKYHTDLEIDIASEEDYDEIQDIKADLYKLYDTDYKECFCLFEGMEQELRSQYSMESSVASLTYKFSGSIEGLVEKVSQKVEDFDMSQFGFKGEELNKFKNLLNKYGK
jgi:hypothetical protein